MQVEARLKSGAMIQTVKLGMTGQPFHAGPGAKVTFPSEESYEKAVALYGDGIFELIAPAKSGKKEGSK
jgi:hypothetical protein